MKIGLSLILLATPALGGCVAQAALAAAQLAQYVPTDQGPSNAHLRPAAIQACTQRAQRHGTVFILDVEQRSTSRLVVWGSVIDAQQQRRTFECQFTSRLVDFRLRDVASPS